MELNTRASLLTKSLKVEEGSHIKMVIFIKETGKMVKLMVMACSCKLIKVLSMMGSGITMKCMDMVLKHGMKEG